MKIVKFIEFIKEEFQDTPESYVELALKQLKHKIDKMFDFQESEEETGNQEIEKVKRKEKNKMSFKDLGVRLESSEISKFSKLLDSLTVKFSDEKFTYTLIFMIELRSSTKRT